MKRYIFLLIVALTMTVAQAQSYTYLNFVDKEAAVTQVTTENLKITFADGNAVVSVGEESVVLPLSSLDYMVFTNSEYSENEYARGDVNGDNIIDVEDVNAVINVILKVSAADAYPGVCDVNGDGIVDVEDVNAIINIILKV